jgi:GDSL-like lipase/acylhydrolase family protein
MKLCIILLLILALGVPLRGVYAQDDPEREEYRPIEDVPGLPRVLLIGDSISVGYTLPTRALLEGEANVHRIPENGGPTIKGLEHIEEWLGDGKWDVVHFNWGLHDLKVMGEQNQVPLNEYAQNMEKLVTRLQATGAKLIWAATTPVPEGDVRPLRRPADVPEYNAAAKRVMAAHKIPINDLNSFALPILEEIQRPVNVHFTDEGSKRLAERVAVAIRKALKTEEGG